MTQALNAPPIDPDQPGFSAPGTDAGPEVQSGGAQEDYFGFSDTRKWYLPDGVSYMELKLLNEGAKKRFQKQTQRDVVLDRSSGDARFSVDQAEERHALIIEAVIDWNMLRNGVPTRISTNGQNNKQNLKDWLELANPKLVESLEAEIRKMNPWLMGEMTVADIDREISRLQELRTETVAREAEKASSGSK